MDSPKLCHEIVSIPRKSCIAFPIGVYCIYQTFLHGGFQLSARYGLWFTDGTEMLAVWVAVVVKGRREKGQGSNVGRGLYRASSCRYCQ